MAGESRRRCGSSFRRRQRARAARGWSIRAPTSCTCAAVRRCGTPASRGDRVLRAGDRGRRRSRRSLRRHRRGASAPGRSPARRRWRRSRASAGGGQARLRDSIPIAAGQRGDGLASGALVEALKYFRRAIELDPSYPEAYRRVGDAVEDIDPEAVDRVLQKSLALDPRQEVIHADLAGALGRSVGKTRRGTSCRRLAAAAGGASRALTTGERSPRSPAVRSRRSWTAGRRFGSRRADEALAEATALRTTARPRDARRLKFEPPDNRRGAQARPIGLTRQRRQDSGVAGRHSAATCARRGAAERGAAAALLDRVARGEPRCARLPRS